MAEEAPKPEVPEWWKSTLTAAWIDTRMEADRTAVALSAGGIALLVTLLTTVGVRRGWMIAVYAVAFAGFLAAIVFGIIIFRRNAKHLEEAIVDPDTAHSSKTRDTLRGLDWSLWITFGLGVVASIGIGIASSVGTLRTVEMNQTRAPALQEHTEGRRDQGRRSTGARDTAQPADTVQEESGRDHEPPADAATGG